MLTFSFEKDHNGKPPERESGPSADGDPGRSRNDVGTFSGKTTLVSDDTQEFEEQQTGISINCDPTDDEVLKAIPKTKLMIAVDCLNYLLAAMMAIFGIITLIQITRDGATAKLWISAVCQFIVAFCLFWMPNYNQKERKNKYQENCVKKIEIYPDRLVLSENDEELPLDGTGKLLRTEETYTVVFPTKKKRFPRFVVIPFRCIDANVLPYVEAMLIAGTKPEIYSRA